MTVEFQYYRNILSSNVIKLPYDLHAYIIIFECFRQDVKSLKKKMKRRGPRMDPCGTPDVTFPTSDKNSLRPGQTRMRVDESCNSC